MRTVLALLVPLAAACSNDLPPLGACMSPGAATGDAIVEPVHLADGIFFDDLRFAPALGKIVAAPESAPAVYLIDPDTMAVTPIAVAVGLASADASADLVLAADRGHTAVVMIDIATGATLASTDVDGRPDYVRVSPVADEVWVTHPGGSSIEVLSIVRAEPPRLEHAVSIPVPGAPEGLVFDGARAYTQSGGSVIAVDATTRRVVGQWGTGCAGSHGFPMTDDARGLVISGCNSDGGAAVLDAASGDVTSGFEAGGGEAVLAYAESLGHFYLRGDPSPTLSILGVCDGGAMALLGTVPIPNYGHAMAADDRGHVWVADPDHGGVVRVTDPFPAMP